MTWISSHEMYFQTETRRVEQGDLRAARGVPASITVTPITRAIAVETSGGIREEKCTAVAIPGLNIHGDVWRCREGKAGSLSHGECEELWSRSNVERRCSRRPGF
jgi:hypothetical protein